MDANKVCLQHGGGVISFPTASPYLMYMQGCRFPGGRNFRPSLPGKNNFRNRNVGKQRKILDEN